MASCVLEKKHEENNLIQTAWLQLHKHYIKIKRSKIVTCMIEENMT